MEDRLRELIDVVLGSLDEPVNGTSLAARVHFSRDHLDRLLAAATGESPVAMRRRVLLERAAWQLRTGAASASEAAEGAGYGSVAAFSRAFARAYGTPPSAFAGEVELAAPNGIHFHPPAGLLIPGVRAGAPADLTDRLVSHHLDRVRELLAAAATLTDEALAREVRPGMVLVWFEGVEPSAALMCERLVFTLEVWVAAMAGSPVPVGGGSDWGPRFERAALAFERLAKQIRDRGGFDDAFVDALCEPPQSFTYGGVLSHVLTYGAVRREALASALAELGATVSCGDPIVWEARSARTRIARNATMS
ncbi:MAG TPA: helix-turn-helix domain-containing protein [Solirubrobacter sp.]